MKRFTLTQSEFDFSPLEETDVRPFVVFFGNRYAIDGSEVMSVDEANDYVDNLPAEERQYVYPFYVLVHGITRVRLTDFNDKWDSGLGGFVYADPDFRSNLAANADIYKEVEYCVKQMDAYTMGDVWEIYDAENKESYGPFYGKEEAEKELAYLEENNDTECKIENKTYTKEEIINILANRFDGIELVSLAGMF